MPARRAQHRLVDACSPRRAIDNALAARAVCGDARDFAYLGARDGSFIVVLDEIGEGRAPTGLSLAGRVAEHLPSGACAPCSPPLPRAHRAFLDLPYAATTRSPPQLGDDTFFFLPHLARGPASRIYGRRRRQAVRVPEVAGAGPGLLVAGGGTRSPGKHALAGRGEKGGAARSFPPAADSTIMACSTPEGADVDRVTPLDR